MKKSKVILAIVLAVVLLITILNVPTFSWFSRPHELSGEKMMLTTNNAYTGYSGSNVTISTNSSTTGVEGSYTTSVTNSAGLSGSGISTHNRKYFCTTITNDNTGAQNVSLYAKTLSIPTSSNGTLALGVNGPTRSYRDYTSLANRSSYSERDTMRIYFEKDNNVNGWNGTEFYICWNESTDTSSSTLESDGSGGTYYKLTWVGDSNNGNSNRYYADIPKTATHAFFAVENWGTNNNGNPNYWQRSQELYNLAQDGQTKTQSVIYKITNTNSNGNATVVPTTVGGSGGACINHYYNTIFVTRGNTYNAALSSTTNIPLRSGYSANFKGTLSYYSGDTNVFTVNETTGVITAVAAGTATLYTKSTGYYTDTQQVETTVTVTADSNYVFNDVPIVRNILIPAGESVDVYWYVINNSETTALRYTIDSLYLGM